MFLDENKFLNQKKIKLEFSIIILIAGFWIGRQHNICFFLLFSMKQCFTLKNKIGVNK